MVGIPLRQRERLFRNAGFTMPATPDLTGTAALPMFRPTRGAPMGIRVAPKEKICQEFHEHRCCRVARKGQDDQ